MTDTRKRQLTAEQKDKMIAGRIAARAKKAARATSGEAVLKGKASEHANICDAQARANPITGMNAAVLKEAGRLLRALSK